MMLFKCSYFMALLLKTLEFFVVLYIFIIYVGPSYFMGFDMCYIKQITYIVFLGNPISK
jgi:hypothetical protein